MKAQVKITQASFFHYHNSAVRRAATQSSLGIADYCLTAAVNCITNLRIKFDTA